MPRLYNFQNGRRARYPLYRKIPTIVAYKTMQVSKGGLGPNERPMAIAMLDFPSPRAVLSAVTIRQSCEKFSKRRKAPETQLEVCCSRFTHLKGMLPWHGRMC
jgi:hypothetical protein